MAIRKKIIKSDSKKSEVLEGAKNSGALFLAIAFAAFLSVAVLLYLRFRHMEYVEAKPVLIEQGIITPKSGKKLVNSRIQDKLPEGIDSMVVPSFPEFQGQWISFFDRGGFAEFNITGDLFEVVYMDKIQARTKKYSKGRVKYNARSGKLTLYPDQSFPAPIAARGVRYKILTTRIFEIFVKKPANEHTLYFMAPEYTVKSKSYHPLFLLADYGGAPVLMFSPSQVK